MRTFTIEEKERIINTPITKECFEMDNFVNVHYRSLTEINNGDSDIWELVIAHCEGLRRKYNETKDERYFIELVRLLPSSYKMVKL